MQITERNLFQRILRAAISLIPARFGVVRAGAMLAIVFSASPTPASEENAKFKISFASRVAVGDTFYASITGSRKMTICTRYVGANEGIVYSSNAVDVAGELKVLGVDKFGSITKIQLTVDKFLNNGAVAVPTKSIVEANFSLAGPSFEIDGKPAATDLVEALKLVATACYSGSGHESADTIYGTTTPQAIGGSWPINREAYIKSMEPMHVHIEPDQVNGTVKLVAHETLKGTPALRLQLDMSVEKLTGGAFPQITIEDGKFVLQETFVIARDGPFKLLSHVRTLHSVVMERGVTEDNHEFSRDMVADDQSSVTYGR